MEATAAVVDEVVHLSLVSDPAADHAYGAVAVTAYPVVVAVLPMKVVVATAVFAAAPDTAGAAAPDTAGAAVDVHFVVAR